MNYSEPRSTLINLVKNKVFAARDHGPVRLRMFLCPDDLSTLALCVQRVEGCVNQFLLLSKVADHPLCIGLKIELLWIMVKLFDELKLGFDQVRVHDLV